MKFTLTYEGKLYSSNSRGQAQKKHNIRREFHYQLKRLWQVNQFLRAWNKENEFHETIKMEEWLASNMPSIHNKRFIPIVTESACLECALQFRLLSPTDAPGQKLDADNQIKVLFDALKMPKAGQLLAEDIVDDENPFYVLLEDDGLVVKITSISDELLSPLPGDDSISANDCRVFIDVFIRPLVPQAENVIFYSEENPIWSHDYGKSVPEEYTDLSNRQLKAEVTQFIYRLRALSTTFRQSYNKFIFQIEEEYAARVKETINAVSANHQNWNEFFRDKAAAFRLELNKRIYGEPPFPSDDREIAIIRGSLVGPDPVGDVAALLDGLIRRLP